MTEHKIKSDDENFVFLESLLENNRSIRRFDNSRKIDIDKLHQIVSLVRLCASGRNAQPLKYRIINSEEECNEIFPLLAWAGYYTEWDGPTPQEQPVAYLVQCLDTNISKNPLCDEGLQLEAITLGASAMGLGCCIIKAFNAPRLSKTLNLPSYLEPKYVVALGYPAEVAKIVEMGENGDFKYFRNECDEQCVPKRRLSELMI